MPEFSADATKWGAIGAIGCFAIFAILVGALFWSERICTAEYGDSGTLIGACTQEESLDDRVRRITAKDEIGRLGDAVAGDQTRALGVARAVHAKFPEGFREIANIKSQASEAALYSLDDAELIKELDRRFADQVDSIDGDNRFTRMQAEIDKVPLWSALRAASASRTNPEAVRNMFSPLADRYKASQPQQAFWPAKCTVRGPADGTYADEQFLLIESLDGSAQIVREMVTDPMGGRTDLFHLNRNDARALRLTVGTRSTNGEVYIKPASKREVDTLFFQCKPDVPAVEDADEVGP